MIDPKSDPASDPLSTPLTVSLLAHEATSQASRVTLSVRELLDALAEYDVRAEKSGGSWSPIVWRGDTRAASNAESVSCLVYDLDSASPDDLSALGGRIDASGLIHAIHETHTPGRFRVVFPLESPLSPAQYPDALRSLAETLAIPGLDESCGDLARLFYLPSHPPGESRLAGSGGSTLYAPDSFPDSARFRLKGSLPEVSDSRMGEQPSERKAPTEFQGNVQPQEARENENPPENNSEKIFDLEALRESTRRSSLATDVRRSLLEVLNQTLVLKRGERENQLHRLTCALVSVFPEGVSKSDAESVVETLFVPLVERMERDKGAAVHSKETPEYFLSRVGSSFDRAWEHREARLKKRAAIRAAAEKFLKPAEGDPSAWRARLLQQSTKEGPRVKACTSNLDLILEHDEAFKGYVQFDELKRAMHFDGGALHDANLSTVGLQLSNWLQTSPYNIDMAETVCGRALLLAARRHTHNPVAEYLESLVWDGVPRIHETLTKFCEAEGNRSYVQDITRKFFISAAARGLSPGCKVDTVLVLQGPQGTRKTSFVECLAGDWYTTVSGKTDDKDTKMQATSAWFVELSELASMGKSTVESLRGFLTQRIDHIRLPYAAAHEEFQRRCVFVGTTNSEQPLIDQEGNRRFWVVTCGRINIKGIESVRDQLWAEAVWCFRQWQAEQEQGVLEDDSKYRWWLTPREQELSNEENSIYQAENPMESEIALWMAQQDKPLEELDPMTVTEVAKKCLGMTSEMLNRDVSLVQRVGRTLGQMGWAKIRVRRGGKRVWAYQPTARLDG